jgi:hypothetical protein
MHHGTLMHAGRRTGRLGMPDRRNKVLKARREFVCIGGERWSVCVHHGTAYVVVGPSRYAADFKM